MTDKKSVPTKQPHSRGSKMPKQMYHEMRKARVRADAIKRIYAKPKH